METAAKLAFHCSRDLTFGTSLVWPFVYMTVFSSLVVLSSLLIFSSSYSKVSSISLSIFWSMSLCLSSSAKTFFLKVRYSFLTSASSRADLLGRHWLGSKIWVDWRSLRLRLGRTAEVFLSSSSLRSVRWAVRLGSRNYYYRVLLRAVISKEECTRERELLNSLSTDSERSRLGANLVGSSLGLLLSILLRRSLVLLTSFHFDTFPDIIKYYAAVAEYIHPHTHTPTHPPTLTPDITSWAQHASIEQWSY